jgi:hypothetical protein
MRSREEIIKSRASTEALFLELLLDIRDLLTKKEVEPKEEG